MIPKEDLYADKDGKLTDDPTKYATQVAVAGVNLDDRIAKRFGIMDSLISVDEPSAPRRMLGESKASVKIVRSEDKAEEKKEEKTQKPQEPAAAETKKTSAAKKGEKTK